MKVLVKPSSVLGDLEDFIECCEVHAWFWFEGWIPLQAAVDNLQWLAERWGLVDEGPGQDRIQLTMSRAFVLRTGIGQ